MRFFSRPSFLEIRAPVEGPARGTVIESRLDRGRGPVATVLIQGGTLRRGDTLLAGGEFGKVRGLVDERGREVARAGPSMPVEVLGLSAPPEAGDEAVVVPSERKAREIASLRQTRTPRAAHCPAAGRQAGERLEPDGAGRSAGPSTSCSRRTSRGRRKPSPMRCSNCPRTRSGSTWCRAESAGFERPTSTSPSHRERSSSDSIPGPMWRRAALIEREGVGILYFSVIYDVLDMARNSLSGMLAPEIREEIVGLAEVRDVFRVRRFGAIAGCLVVEGAVRRSLPIRVLRDEVVIFEGELESLRRFKEDVTDVVSGTECGIGVRSYDDVQVATRSRCSGGSRWSARSDAARVRPGGPARTPDSPRPRRTVAVGDRRSSLRLGNRLGCRGGAGSGLRAGARADVPGEDHEETLRALRRAARYLRTRLAGRLRVRNVPELRFEHDRSPETAARIERLLAGPEGLDGP